MKSRKDPRPAQLGAMQSSFLSIPHQLLEAIPTINGKYFFDTPSDPLYDPVFRQSVVFAINPNQQYQAPKLDQSWPQDSEMYQNIDANFAKIQEKQAYITKPLDKLATLIFANVQDPIARINLFRYLHIARSQLAITAQQIQEMRLENHACASRVIPHVASAPGAGTSTSSHPIISEHGSLVPECAGTTKTKPAAKKSKVLKTSLGSSLAPPRRPKKLSNPLHIPEIKIEIGRYLKNSELANCVLVCRDWKKTFTQLLYSNIEITGKARTTPSLEALQHNRTFIRSLSFLNERISTAHTKLALPNLNTLRLHLKEINAGITWEPITMINKSKNITKLELSRISTHDNSSFWESVASLHHLEELSIRFQMMFRENAGDSQEQDKEIHAFWDACSRVKKLDLSSFRFQHKDPRVPLGERTIPGPIIVRTLSNRTFSRLQDLKISQGSMHVSAQVMLIMQCPALERLSWRVLPAHEASPDTALAVQHFSRHLASGKSARLTSLELDSFQVGDQDLAELIRALNNNSLKELELPSTQFGSRAFNALKYHFSTLRVLNLRDCPNLTSANVLELLQAACPYLESLAVDRIYAQYMDPQKIWPCHQTLRRLQIEFELDQPPNINRSSAAAKTPQQLNEIVFSCLGQLHQLEYLRVGYHEPLNQASIPLEFQLSKGLGKLAGLKKLEHFAMGLLAGSLGPKDVDWMMNNWPSLDVLEGLTSVTPKIPRQIVLKRRGITVV
ncbi:hypothetical protein BGZ79_002374 [Entomortierella chlamydospora]|nr:hypothetical protein BGZ79_002374 [Entomortierella chlamydospora]